MEYSLKLITTSLNCGRQTRQLTTKIIGTTSTKSQRTYTNNYKRYKSVLHKDDKYIVRSPFPDIEIPQKTFIQMIWERHAQWGNKMAVECGVTGESYTYEELLDSADGVGQGLLVQGLRPGETIAFLSPNTPDYVVSLLGAARAGLTIASINPLYTPDEISYQLKNSGAKSIIVCPEKIPDVLKVVRTLMAEQKLPDNFQIISSKGTGGREGPVPCGVRPLKEIKLEGRSRTVALGREEDAGSRVAFIAHSSGTTGLPKGVCLTHENVTASILQMAHKETSLFRETSGTFQEIIPIVLPIFHNFGLELTLDALYHGSKVITLPKFEGDLYLKTFKKHKVTALFAVPPMLMFLGQRGEATRDHFENTRLIFTAAAPIGNNDIEMLLEKFPKEVNFIQGYGQTEAMCCLTFTPYGVKNYSSVGIPVVNTQMIIVDLETGLTNPENKSGEICFKGPQMTPGYLNNPKATSECKDGDGWFHTGDVGYYDSEGYFYIIDRIKELIKVKGFQVAPAELEAILRSHPDVEEVGVTGAPHKTKGEAPVGFIKIKSGTNVTEKDLRNFLSTKVAEFKTIEKFIFVDSIPKTAAGKILRKELRALLK